MRCAGNPCIENNRNTQRMVRCNTYHKNPKSRQNIENSYYMDLLLAFFSLLLLLFASFVVHAIRYLASFPSRMLDHATRCIVFWSQLLECSYQNQKHVLIHTYHLACSIPNDELPWSNPERTNASPVVWCVCELYVSMR